MTKKLLSILALLLVVAQGVWAANPNANLESYSGHAGSIHVSGWAFDADSPSSNVSIHIYLYQNNVQKAFVTTATGNHARQDVRNSYNNNNINLYCGFDRYVAVDLPAGTYEMRIAAYNIGAGENYWFRSGVYVTVSAPFSVSYNANGGSGAPSAGVKRYGINMNLSSTEPTRTGYTFAGWNTKADGSGTSYAAGATYTANANLTLYAQWTKNVATLTDGNDLSTLATFAGKTCEVTYSRSFTSGKPSTVCLPFAYAPKTGETFYTFSGITKDGNNYEATMTEAVSSSLTANTPYLFMPTGNADFSGTYTIPAELTAGTTTNGDWTFVGTYTEQKWTEAPTGIYGFSAQAVDGISQGEFVKVGAYVKVKPMRCYLKYKNGSENYANARALTRAAATDEDETLPETIKVRLIGADGTVTAIGTLHTRTGEVSFDSEAWYTLDGKRLAGQPTQKGIYVNNGKKVVIK